MGWVGGGGEDLEAQQVPCEYVLPMLPLMRPSAFFLDVGSRRSSYIGSHSITHPTTHLPIYPLTHDPHTRKQMLKILTDDYHEGVVSSQIAPPPNAAAAAAATGGADAGMGVGVVGGLPPEECIAAVDAGSVAVTDMRNAPPPEEYSPPRTPPLPAEASTHHQQQQVQVVLLHVYISVCVCCRPAYLGHHSTPTLG